MKEDLSRGAQVEGLSRGQCASSTGLQSLDTNMEGALAGTGAGGGQQPLCAAGVGQVA